MKKYILSIVPFILLLNSCGIIKYVDKINNITSEKEVIFYNSKQKFIYKNNGIYLPVIVDGVKDTLMFDTGYTTVFTENSYDSPNIDSCIVIHQTTHKGRPKFFG